jgi:hypothetical protein
MNLSNCLKEPLMKVSHLIVISLSALLLNACSNHAGVSPSQNPSLSAVTPNTAAETKGGAMQRSLDSWLKEDWAPTTSVKTTTAADGTVTTTKTEASQVVTTKTAPNGTVVTTTAPVIQEPEDTTPFTLQKYVDKWKVYNDNKAKMKEGQPKEPSEIDKVNSLPVIGK